MDIEVKAKLSEVGKAELERVEKMLLDAFTSVENIEESIQNIQNIAKDAIPEDRDVCNVIPVIDAIKDIASEVVSINEELVNGVTTALSGATEAVTGLAQDVMDTASEIASEAVSEAKDEISGAVDAATEKIEDSMASVAPGLEDFNLFGIIMKKFQILKLRLKKIQLILTRKIAEICKGVVLWVMKGKGSMLTTPINAVLSALSALATVMNTILSALGIILTLIDTLLGSIGGIEGNGMAFFMTPKSLMIAPGLSVTMQKTTHDNYMSIPSVVQKAIDEAIKKLKEAYATSKFAKIAAAGAAGAASAASEAGLSIGDFGPIDKFNPDLIKDVIKTVSETLLLAFAEPLPRYEKLTPTNIRFLIHLLTSFEPSAKKCFGIPGFP